MTIKPVAYKTKLAGTVGRLELPEDADIGDEVAFVLVGVVKARNDEGTDAGPVRTIGVKAADFHRLPTNLADDLILSVKRHGRARDRALTGDVPIVDEDSDDALGLGDTPDEVVDAWLAGREDEREAELGHDLGALDDDEDDLELEDELDDADGSLVAAVIAAADAVIAAADELVATVDLGDPMPRRPSPGPADDAAYVTALEAAWSHIDAATPGYADLSEAERRARTIGHVGAIAPWSLRQYLLIEVDELAGSELFIKSLEARHEEELARITKEEPWPGYAKATVDAIVGRLESRKTSDEAAGNREAMLEHVEAYELAHKGRKGVLGAIAEERLGHGSEVGVPEPDAGFEPTTNPDAEEE